MTKHFVNEQYDVDEADSKRSFGISEKREDYADSWKDTGNVVLVGLKGAGKESLATLLADRTGQEIVVPGQAEDAAISLKGTGRIIVLSDVLVEDASVQPLIHGAGKVFYLMADTNTLSQRVADRESVEDTEQLWRDMSARLALVEPLFYSVLHFIIQATQSPEELLDDAMEKIAF